MRTDLAIQKIRTCIDNGGKVLICGNGGSLSQAEHFATELVSSGIPCIALTDAAMITAVGNDHGFDHVFSSQVLALGCRGDVLVTLTTSGESENINRAEMAARIMEMLILRLPTGDDVQAVQEQHLCLLHEIWQGLKKEQ